MITIFQSVMIMEVSSFQRVLCYVQTSMELSWGLKMFPLEVLGV